MKVLCRLAEAEGYIVTGSDASTTGHDETNVVGADRVVYSSAIPEENAELGYARAHGIPVSSRAEFLGEVAARYAHVIGVAGSHGKTTCTAMLGCIFAPYNATVHLGGTYNGECGHLGGKRVFITEACEYKRNFLYLLPRISVVLNVELDHTDYYRDLADITDAFNVFSRSAPLRIVCGDDERSMPLLSSSRSGRESRVQRGQGSPCITFGFGKFNDYTAENVRCDRGETRFSLCRHGGKLGEITLRVMGKHNVYNALAAAAASFASGLSFQDIKRGLEQFTGVDRRLQKLGRVGNCDVFSDYAHHPHEIESTIESLKNAGYARVGIIFEPHTYTRTQSLLNDFADALRHADDVCLAAVYPAREAPIEGVSSHALARALIERGKNACAYDTFCELYRRAAYFTAKCDALAFCGAGIIDRAAAGFFKAHTAE